MTALGHCLTAWWQPESPEKWPENPHNAVLFPRSSPNQHQCSLHYYMYFNSS